MKYGSVFSGIEGASVAAEGLDWSPAFFAEIDPFCCELLRLRYPDTPNMGDVVLFCDMLRSIDRQNRKREKRGDQPLAFERQILPENGSLLIGGSPCQAFSIAGKRKSLEDDRGNLTLKYVQLVHALDPEFVVWENVDGVLSTKDNAFGSFLAGLVGEQTGPLFPDERSRNEFEAGGGVSWSNAGMVIGPRRSAAWRVIDAQYTGLAQRRRRVFVVSCRTRDGINPAAVLLEPDSVPRNTPPSREEGEGAAAFTPSGLGAYREGVGILQSMNPSVISPPLNIGQGPAVFRMAAFGDYAEDDLASTLKERDYKDSTDLIVTDARGNGDGKVAGTLTGDHRNRITDYTQIVAFSCKDSGGDAGDVSPTLRSMGFDKSHMNAGGQVAVAFSVNQRREGRLSDVHACLNGSKSGSQIDGVIENITPLAFTERSRKEGRTVETSEDQAYALTDPSGGGQAHSRRIMDSQARVRRLTPTECERLQGFPDQYTRIPYGGSRRFKDIEDMAAYWGVSEEEAAEMVADSHRYRSLGNSFAVNVVRWIFERIEKVRSARMAA